MADSEKAPEPKKRPVEPEAPTPRFSLRHRAWALFAFAALLSIVFVGIDARGTLAAGDEWDYFHRLATRPLPEALFDAPPDKYLLAVPLFTVYLPLAEIFGIGEALPLRLAGIGLVVLAAGLTMEFTRRRAGFAFGLCAAILLLFFGAAGEILATPQRIPGLMATCFGLGMLLALDRQDRRGDITASVLGVLGVASHPVMLPFLAGAGVRIVFARRDRVRRFGLVLAPALVAFLAWRLAIYEQLETPFGQTVSGVIEFAGDHFVALVAALSGLFRGPFVDGVDFVTGISVAFAILIALALVFVVVRRRGITVGLLAALAILAVALIAPAVGPSGALRTPSEPRYIHPGGIIVLILLAELIAAGKPWPRRSGVVAWAAAAVWLFLAMPANIAELHDRADYAALSGDIVRAELAALEMARQEPASTAAAADAAEGDQNAITALAFRGGEFGETPGGLIVAGAPAYFDVADAYGTPALKPSELATTRPDLREQADIVLVAALGIAPRPAAPPPAEAEDAERTSEDEAVVAAGSCVRVGEPAEPPAFPAEPPPEGVGAALTPLTVPPGEVWIEGSNTEGLRVGRFGDTATRPLPLTPGEDAALTLPVAGAEDMPWLLQLYGDGPVTLCAT